MYSLKYIAIVIKSNNLFAGMILLEGKIYNPLLWKTQEGRLL